MPHGYHKEKIGDRLGDQANRPLAHQDAKPQAQAGPEHARDQGFAEYQTENFSAGDPQAAQRSKQRPPLNYRKVIVL